MDMFAGDGEDDEVFSAGDYWGLGLIVSNSHYTSLGLDCLLFLGRLFCFCFLLSANEKYHASSMM